MTTDILTCHDLVELITDYLEQALPPEQQIRVEAHLALCPHCHAYLEQMRMTLQLLGMLSEEHVSPEAQTTLLELFRHWKAQE